MVFFSGFTQPITHPLITSSAPAAPEPAAVPGWAGFTPGPPAYQQQQQQEVAAPPPPAAPVVAAPRPIPQEHQCIQVGMGIYRYRRYHSDLGMDLLNILLSASIQCFFISLRQFFGWV